MGVNYHGLKKLRVHAHEYVGFVPAGVVIFSSAFVEKASNTLGLCPIRSEVETSPQILCESELPSSLADLPRPPRRLYLNGALPNKPMIAIVGTRRPTVEAEDFARTLAQQLVGHGFAVASGGAEGIDTAAHRGALAAAGQTLVVAPAGWNEPYPQSNRELFREVVDRGGGYVSIVGPDQRALVPNFLGRNAVLVALATATVMVQAPLKSGARNSAHVARSIGRLLFVVPSAPWVEPGAGCVLELRLGARPLGCLRDLLAGLSETGVHGRGDPLQLKLALHSQTDTKPRQTHQICEKSDHAEPQTNSAKTLSCYPELAPVTDALAHGCNTLDSICLRSGWNTPKVQAALLRLTLTGCIRITSAGRIEIVTH